MRKKLVYFVMIGQWCFYLFFSIWFKSIFGIIAFSILGVIGILSYKVMSKNSCRESWSDRVGFDYWSWTAQ